jgi:hypothetical protein
MRNIRRKNEQVFLSPVPRGYSLYRVSSSGKLNGLSLPTRRDLRFIPYVSGSVNDDRTLRTNEVDRTGRLGIDVKWGVRADLTLDATVNTDFAQVEADEEQVNLTRFALVFPEKRPFFLENAQLFQVGQPQGVDLFFSRRIGLDPTGQPIDILGGARLSGKLGGGYNVGLLNLQTDEAFDHRTGAPLAPGNNFTVVRLQREIGRSNFGGIVVNRQGTGSLASADDFNRAYGLDAAWQTSTNGRLFAFFARTDSPTSKGARTMPAVPITTTPALSGALRRAIHRWATGSTPRLVSCSAAPTAVWKAATAFRISPSAGRRFGALCRR